MKAILAAAGLSLAGCASVGPPEPIVRTVEVRVPVPVPCVPADADLSGPDYPDTDAELLAAEDAAERYSRLFAGRGLREAREADLVARLEACRAPD